MTEKKACTWCKGKRYISKARRMQDFRHVDWVIFVGSFLLLIAAVQLFGKTHGTAVLLFLVFVVFVVPILQEFFEIGSFLGFFRRREKCPHCTRSVPDE